MGTEVRFGVVSLPVLETGEGGCSGPLPTASWRRGFPGPLLVFRDKLRSSGNMRHQGRWPQVDPPCPSPVQDLSS